MLRPYLDACHAWSPAHNTVGEVIGVDVKPYELVEAQITTADVTVQTP